LTLDFCRLTGEGKDDQPLNIIQVITSRDPKIVPKVQKPDYAYADSPEDNTNAELNISLIDRFDFIGAQLGPECADSNKPGRLRPAVANFLSEHGVLIPESRKFVAPDLEDLGPKHNTGGAGV
jgi:hypothetical protein